MSKHLLVIGGATATGKTAISIRLARHFQTEIISADSRQFFREMNIGTAKPSSEELEAAKHHFVNSLSITDDYSVGQFERDSLDLLQKLYEKHDLIVLSGGSGLYIKAVYEGLDEFPEVPEAIKREVINLWKESGIEALQEELKEADPEYYNRVDLQNPHRLIRALSVSRAGRRPYSSYLTSERKNRFFTPIYILLDLPREILYDRINNRVDEMITNGLIEEARALYPHRELPSLQTVGYQELFEHFDGKITLKEAIELIKRNSRRYAKRQVTWFRRNPEWEVFSPNNFKGIVRYVKGKVNYF